MNVLYPSQATLSDGPGALPGAKSTASAISFGASPSVSPSHRSRPATLTDIERVEAVLRSCQHTLEGMKTMMSSQGTTTGPSMNKPAS